jgi:Tol biopolymer transport system component
MCRIGRGINSRLHLFGVMLLGLIVCAGSAGCGSGSAATPTPTPTPAPTPTPIPTPTPNPTPTVTTVSPANATVGGLAFTLSVHGASFVPTSTVEWNGNSRTTTFVSNTELQAHIMQADLAAAGNAAISVVNPTPGGGSSSPLTFTIAADTLVFTSARLLNGNDAANAAENIWSMNSNGSNPAPLTNLTALNANSMSAAWSPDGSKVAFLSLRALDGSNSKSPNGPFNIWVMNADGSNPTAITKLTATAASAFDLAWSPDNSAIAFASPRALDGSDAVDPNQTSNIWVISADGSKLKPLTHLSAFICDSRRPTWSPDGSKIAYDSERVLDGTDNGANTNSTPNIWIMNADGTNPTPVTRLTNGAITINGAWSPDGSRIAFSSQRPLDGTNTVAFAFFAFNIWVMNVDGSGPTPLTKMTGLAANAHSGEPAWSPDGSKIVYGSRRALDGSNAGNANLIENIWVMNADGSNQAPLTKVDAVNGVSETPFWSPGGDKIFFASRNALDGSNAVNTNLAANIWVVNADGSHLTPLTTLKVAESREPRQP